MTQDQLKEMIKGMMLDELTTLGETVTSKTIEAVEKKIEEKLKPAKPEIIDDGVPKPADPKGGFKCFSEFASQVAKASVNPMRIDKRLSDLQNKAASATSLNESDAEYGGFLIPEEFRNELLSIAIQKSNIMSMARMIPMQTNSINIPYIADTDHSAGKINGGVQFSWLDEEATKTETRPKFGKINLRLKKCAGLAYTSDEILQDSPITMEPLLTSMFTDALTFELDDVFLNGSGAGRPLGILNAPCLVTITKESGQGAATIMFENIIKMYARVSSKSNCVWMANDDTFTQLASMSLAVGTGGVPVWLPAGGANGKPYDTLMGKPLIFTEHCQAKGTKGDIFLCDWSQYLIGQKAGSGSGLQFASSIHLKFDADQTCFRFVFRVDGQPWWAAAQIPRYSSDTVSPFICIETRS